MEILLDKVEKSLLIKCKLFKKIGLEETLKIPLDSVISIKKKIIIKKDFVIKRIAKDDQNMVAFFSNFGINYLYVLRKIKDFVIITLSLKDHFINYLVLALSKQEYELLKRNLPKTILE